ncbi:MAG: MarR family transcriptional regulator [Firmicutes bacterium]|nr:MarR family transcriptional regulator [Bacillota bacterium]
MKDNLKENKYDCIRLRNQLCFPLYACSKEVIRKYRKPLEKLGLTYTQYVVMMALWEFGTMTESELGEKVYLDSGTLAPLLKRLEKQGVVNRVRPDDNERKLCISLTEKGQALQEEAIKIPEAMQGCMNLTPEEMMQLKTLLDKALNGTSKNS